MERGQQVVAATSPATLPFVVLAMQFLVKQASVGALVALIAGVASAREAGATSTGPKVVPGGYVVELESAANVSTIISVFSHKRR